MAEQVDASTERSIRTRQTVRLVVLAAAAIALVLFGLLNTDAVVIDWIVTDTETDLWIVIAVAAGLGFLVGYAVRSRRE